MPRPPPTLVRTNCFSVALSCRTTNSPLRRCKPGTPPIIFAPHRRCLAARDKLYCPTSYDVAAKDVIRVEDDIVYKEHSNVSDTVVHEVAILVSVGTGL